MSIVVPFRGKRELDAADNLRLFVEHARNHCPFPGIDWESHAWNVTLTVTKRARGRNETWLNYSSWRDSKSTQKKSDFMREPFVDFVKATVCEVFRRSKPREPGRWIYALRAVEHALVEFGGATCVTVLSPPILDRAAELLAERCDDPWNYGRYIERAVTEVINPAGVARAHIDWKSPFKWRPPTRHDAVYEDNRAAKRLPDIGALVALGEIHQTSAEVQDRVITSYMAIALFGPSRGCEILSLPVDCATKADSDDGELMGLRWEPAKGALPLTRFAASDASEEIAEAAIAYLEELGREARVAAKWYADNRNSLYLPSGFEQLRGQPLTLWEIARILGRDRPISSVDALDFGWGHAVARTTDSSRWDSSDGKRRHWVGVFAFDRIERWALEQLPQAFPVLDEHTGLQWHDALFVLPHNSLVKVASPMRHVPQPTSTSMINHHLGAMPKGHTIFARNGKCRPDGRPWKITTHQPRHLLNTLAQSKHLPQALIAFWSGRKSVAQNAWYDHVPQETYIEAYRKLGEGAPALHVVGPLAEKAKAVAVRAGISYDDALKTEIGAVHTTRYGLCRHDYALTPCPKDKDCISCGEHAVTKGDPRHYQSAVVQRDLYVKAVKRSREAVERGEPGAVVWLRRNEPRARRWTRIVELLEDPSIPDRTVITLPPPETSFTRVDRAMDAVQDQTRQAAGPASDHDLDDVPAAPTRVE